MLLSFWSLLKMMARFSSCETRNPKNLIYYKYQQGEVIWQEIIQLFNL